MMISREIFDDVRLALCEENTKCESKTDKRPNPDFEFSIKLTDFAGKKEYQRKLQMSDFYNVDEDKIVWKVNVIEDSKV